MGAGHPIHLPIQPRLLVVQKEGVAQLEMKLRFLG